MHPEPLGREGPVALSHQPDRPQPHADSPIAHIEHGNVLLLLHGEKKEDAVADAYEKAAKAKPKDAMEALDAAWAKDQLE